MASPKTLPAWTNLQARYETVKDLQLRDLFAEDPQRYARFSLRFEDILLDYSKNRITTETLEELLALATQCDVAGWRERMFAGEKINSTEDRAVLHVALRNRSDRAIRVEGADVMQAVMAELEKCATSRRRCGRASTPALPASH